MVLPEPTSLIKQRSSKHSIVYKTPTFKLHSFVISAPELEVTANVIKMKDSIYIWLGNHQKPLFNDLSMAMHIDLTSQVSSTKLLGGKMKTNEIDIDCEDFWSTILENPDENESENKENYVDNEIVEKYYEITNDKNEAAGPSDTIAAVGDWILVKFATKKTVKHFVGLVQEINDNGCPIVKYVRKTACKTEGENVFTFPNVEDISEVHHMEDIEIKLPKPITGRRGQIIFKLSFKNYNVQ